ncbi:MAG: glycoside hydrolase family 97 catalytic domain-containing protein, partial [Acidobacteria bacterium]|nr:glycoside hydrolase family 97 catalytic domain-containing protein [Acidobacteriota bacterium]
DLVNSGLVRALSPAPDPKLFPQGAATAWVKPGRAVWKYLDGGQNDAATVREFSRLAGQLGFEYQVVEAFWQKWSAEELKEIIAESKAQGVGLILWKHSKDLRTPEERKAFFDQIAAAGAAGAKIDFFDHEAKEVVELYEVLLREAAERQLLLNFHGANKPAGESYMWPNELTREAVRGMESGKSPRARHDATLPFTRLLAGPADYTPVHFGARRNDTTWAHQLATAIVFTSGLLTYAANPRSLVDSPAVELIKAIPASWDETRVLAGSEIGEVAILARRKGADWYVTVVNGAEARQVAVDLSFLPAGRYQGLAAQEADGNPASVEMKLAEWSQASRIVLELPAGGGFAARLTQR